jgi:hypothetical protein
MSKETPKISEQFPNEFTAKFGEGSITYSLIGEASPDHHPIVWVPGADQGRINTFDAAKLLAENGHRQVLIIEQPVYDENIPAEMKKDPDQALKFQAEAVLAACTDAELIGEGEDGEQKIIDAVGHSFGALVLERVKQIAKKRGIEAFDAEKGSKTVLPAPTGSNERETLRTLGGRWLPYAVKSTIEGKTLDPSGQKGKAIIANALADRGKTLGEVKAMATKRIDYETFGGSRALVYPEDVMFPEGKLARKDKAGFIRSIMEKDPDLDIGFATPIDNNKVAHKGLRRVIAKAAVLTPMRKNYVRSYRGAGHNDPTDNPERTANAILNYLDNGSAVRYVRQEDGSLKTEPYDPQKHGKIL